MTTLEQPRGRVNIAPMMVALALALSFAVGIVVGGPVLNVSLEPTPWSASQQLLESGQQWELQRTQQTVQHTSGSGRNASVLAGGRAWEVERQQVTQRHR